jgi:hypothetical protein
VLSDIPSKRIFFVPGKRKLQQVSTITWILLQFRQKGCLLHIQWNFPLTHWSRKEQIEFKISATV